MTTPRHPRYSRQTLAAIGVAAISLTACGSYTTAASEATTTAVAGSAAAKQVLPVTENPINNTSTVEALKIDSGLVENNVDSAGKTVDDHLEFALSNTGTTALTGFEIYYTIKDPTANTSESYYQKLPSAFEIAPGASRTVHFDQSGAPDHFPDNTYSLFHTSKNALTVDVEVSAQGAAVTTARVKKDAGGAENPSE